MTTKGRPGEQPVKHRCEACKDMAMRDYCPATGLNGYGRPAVMPIG